MIIANGMEFINDEAAIGKWRNIGWLDDTKSTSLEMLNAKSGEFEDLFFLPNGEPYWIFEGWTKGSLLLHHGGDAPILTYPYEIQISDNKPILFLRLEAKTEVFIKISDQHYEKATLGRHDNIDLPFICDNRALGKWYSVGFVERIEDFNPKSEQKDLYLKSIEFFSDGTAIQKYMDAEWKDKWTADALLSLHRTTAAKYVIQRINGKEYLFLEWKMGNYIYGGMKPDIYVFSR